MPLIDFLPINLANTMCELISAEKVGTTAMMLVIRTDISFSSTKDFFARSQSVKIIIQAARGHESVENDCLIVDLMESSYQFDDCCHCRMPVVICSLFGRERT